MDIVENAINKLRKFNQEEIIEIMLKLGKDNQEKLASQILNTDFEKIFNLYNSRNDNMNEINDVEPIEYVDKNLIDKEEKEQLRKIGQEILKNEQYAVVTMAGGQGTRLGFNGPKGTLKLDIGENGKYIFEILVESLKRAEAENGKAVYWYIMTSKENNSDTISFFEEHNYFGYKKEKIKFFIQDCLEMILENGNLIIDNKFNIKTASNGNGSIFKSLDRSGMLADMKEKGVKWIYICGVDNIMMNMVDDLLLGLTIKNNMESASKSVKKSCPEERVGLFCKKNGKPAIIEYAEMDEEMINAKDINGELIYGESNILGHLFKIESIERMAKVDLKYHCAHKKSSYLDLNLNEIVPEKPNAYKFESFIFDGFNCLENMLILRVNRNEEFAPIKNKSGVDSPETAKKIYEEYFNI